MGCGGLRRLDHDVAVLGIELSPCEWGRFGFALDASTALVRCAFDTLNLKTIIGNTASGKSRVESSQAVLGPRSLLAGQGQTGCRLTAGKK
jgi:hypothetical protein